MSAISYAGVELSFLSTLSMSWDPQYDDLAGRDKTTTKVTLSASFVVTSGYAPSLPGESLEATWARIHHLLNSPRRPFTYSAGGSVLLSSTGVDADNGPLSTCTINRVVGTEALACTIRIETWIVDCANGLPYVSNRFNETCQLDELGYSRRTRTGQIVARSDRQPNADELRHIVVPPLETDCIRVRSQYHLSADGLRLDYTHEDQEVWLMPPEPAAKAEGSFSVSSADAKMFYGECSLHLEGGKTTDKAVLMRRAISIGLSKLEQAGLKRDPPTGHFLLYCTYSEDMYKNSVSVRLRGLIDPGDTLVTTEFPAPGGVGPPPQGVKGRAGRAEGFRGPPLPVIGAGMSPQGLAWLKVPYIHTNPDGGFQFDPGSRGTAQFLLGAAAMNDPCLRRTEPKNISQLKSDPNQVSANEPATISIQHTFPSPFKSLHQATGTGVYGDYTVAQATIIDPQVLVLPVGRGGKPPVIIRTGEAVTRRRVTWSAAKMGGIPSVPDAVPADPNLVLVGAEITPNEVGLGVNGSSGQYSVSGNYEYVLKDPTKAVITPALPPWIDATRVDRDAVAKPFVFSKLATGFVNAGPSVVSLNGVVRSSSAVNAAGGDVPGYDSPIGDR